MACRSNFFLWCLILFLSMLANSVEAKTQLADELILLAKRSFPESGQCTFLFKNPKDFENFHKDEQIFYRLQQTHSILMGSDLSKALTAVRKCSLVILSQENTEDLNRTIATLTSTVYHVALVIISYDGDVAQNVPNYFNDERLKIDLHTIAIGTRKTMVKSLLVSENQSWNKVKYTFVNPSPAFFYSKTGNHGGKEWAFLEELSKRTGVSYEFLPSRNNFNGMMEMVANGEADLTMCHAAYSYKRYKLTGDISTAIGERRMALAARKPSPMAAEWTLTYPFDVYTWAMLGLSMAIALMLLKTLAASIPGSRRTSNFHLFALSVSVIISEAMPQSLFSIRLLRRSGLLFLFMWLQSSLVISLAYKSTLLASLVALKYEDAIDTWQELLDSDTTLVVPSNQIHNELLRTSNRAIIQKIYQKNVIGKGSLHKYPLPPEVQKTIDDGQTIEIHALEKQAERKHIYSLKGEMLEHSPMGCYFTPKFPWREQLDLVLISLQEVGFVDWFDDDRLFQKSKAYRQFERTESKLDQERKLSLTHMRLTWIVLIVGIMPSILCFILESLKFR